MAPKKSPKTGEDEPPVSGWLTTPQAAAELGVSASTVRRLIRLKRLAATRPALRDFRISRDALDSYKAKCRVRPAPVTHRVGRLPKRDVGSLMELARVLTLRDMRRTGR